MPASVPLRRDFDARHLRKLASRCKDARQSRRLLSLAAVYDGMRRAEAARIGWDGSPNPAGLGSPVQRRGTRMASPTARARAGRAT